MFKDRTTDVGWRDTRRPTAGEPLTFPQLDRIEPDLLDLARGTEAAYGGHALEVRIVVEPRAAGAHLLHHGQHRLQGPTGVPNAGDPMLEEEGRHDVGEAAVVRQVDVEVPETRDEEAAGAVHHLGGLAGRSGLLHRHDAAVVHHHGPAGHGPLHGVHHGDVLDDQIRRRLRRAAGTESNGHARERGGQKVGRANRAAPVTRERQDPQRG